MLRSENRMYKCDWCSHEFEQELNYDLKKKHRIIKSVQIRCPKCLNFIKTE
jgi:DNA-directed RNA polymerase subunit RPC12/RpoP